MLNMHRKMIPIAVSITLVTGCGGVSNMPTSDQQATSNAFQNTPKSVVGATAFDQIAPAGTTSAAGSIVTAAAGTIPTSNPIPIVPSTVSGLTSVASQTGSLSITSELCLPSATGRDYQVGPNSGQLASLDLVPWPDLRAGDTVRIFYRPEPYRGKMLIQGNGTADAPIRICGVKGPNNERPIVDGQNATTRLGMNYGHPLHESRSVIVVKGNKDIWTHFPTEIKIHGLAIRGANPGNTFKDSFGVIRSYEAFGACLWIERGQGVSVIDNEISNCSMAVFSRSTEDGDFAVTKRITLALNNFFDNGIVDSYYEHTTYIQSIGVLYEFNRYGALKAGATGSSLKDRSVGTIIRYNRIEDGARALDLVEAEDYPTAALADPEYRKTWVYGNQISKVGSKGCTIHYGGDHAGSEAVYRKGTLYFFSNTVHVTGATYACFFQISTLDETVEAWNNIFVTDSTEPTSLNRVQLRASQDNAPGIDSGGIVNLGRNWVLSPWTDGGIWGKVIGGQLNGTANLIAEPTSVVVFGSLVPKAGTSIIDSAQAQPISAAAHPVQYQLDLSGKPVPRVVVGGGMDIGAIELQ
jgi:hypothetical protein